VAVVCNLCVTAVLGSLARKSARRGLGTTGQRRLQDGASAVAANLVEDGISARSTGTFMTQLLATMLWVAAFQLTTTCAGAYMLSLKVVSRSLGCRVQRPRFASVRLSLGSLFLSCTTMLSAFMTPTVERNSTDSHALRRLFNSLVANCSRGGATASACNRNFLHTGKAFSLVA
jgi:hypothetical protein